MNWDKEFYYVECHTSFTYSYGKITTDVNEFNVMYIKGNVYKMTIEQNLIRLRSARQRNHSDYISGWIKCQDDDNDYGSGSRHMVEGEINGWIPHYYTEFFLTPTQTEREKKLKELLYE